MSVDAPRRPVAVVSARMNSRRFPGKAMAELRGRPILAWVVESLRECSNVEDVVVATSTQEFDDVIDQWCRLEGVAVFRGSLDDPLGRAIEAAHAMRADCLVRISGDSPLMYPPLVGEMMRLFRDGHHELVTNVFPRTFPRGMSVEIADLALFERIAQATQESAHREHMTLFIYENSDRYRIRNVYASEVFGRIDASVDLSRLNLSVDSPQDIETLVAFLSRQPKGGYPNLDWEDLALSLTDFSKAILGDAEILMEDA